jgi:dipeptidase E
MHDLDAYTARTAAALAGVVQVVGVHQSADPLDVIASTGAVFVGGGNTFRLLAAMHERSLLEPLRELVDSAHVNYMGSSAGTNLACPTIKTTNDMPIVEVPTLDALNLLDFQINPHYLDADPASTHMGETRQTRLEEYLQENPLPVLGLREGAWLTVTRGDRRQAVELHGASARLMRRGHAPVDVQPGSTLGALTGSAEAGSS